MPRTVLDEILSRLRATQLEVDQEIDHLLAEGRERFRYSRERGKVVFERGIRGLHREQRIALLRYLRRAPIAHLLSAPLIYGLILPLILLDLSLMLYQQVCFRIYGIPLVRRGDYLVIDRHRLAYLNLIEKLNCLYCGYGNQLIEYAREVAGRTERYWCPIKHAQRTPDPHSYVQRFFDYGDFEAYAQGLHDLRKDWGSDSNRL